MSEKSKENPDYVFKIVLGGDSGVGKTSLMKRLINDEFMHQRAPTFGVEYGIYNLKVDDCTIKAQIWDTAGQERYRAIAPAYYRGSVGAILVYDISYLGSFERISGWLSEVRKQAEDVLIMLIGNKTDMRPVRAVSTSEASVFAEQNDLFFMEASALDDHNVHEAFDTLLKEIYYRVKEKKLEEGEAKGKIGKSVPVLLREDKEKHEKTQMRFCCT